MVLIALFCLGLLWLYLYCERCNRNFNRDCLKSIFDSKCIQTMCFQTRNMEHTFTYCLYFKINLSSKFHLFIIKIFILFVKYFHMLLMRTLVNVIVFLNSTQRVLCSNCKHYWYCLFNVVLLSLLISSKRFC